MRLVLLFCLVAGCAVACQAGTADPTTGLRAELRALAAQVAHAVEKHGGGTVYVGEFTGPADAVGHTGVGMRQALVEELRSARLIVDQENHRFEVFGRYQPFHDTAANRIRFGGKASRATNLNAVRLAASLIDVDSGVPITELSIDRLVFGAEAVPATLGVNLTSPPLGSLLALSALLDRAKTEPLYQVDGTKLTDLDGRYGIEVLVGANGAYQPAAVTTRDGLPFATLDGERTYGVRIHNPTDHETAVSLTIDGVDTLAFDGGGSRYRIVPPRSHLDVLGWRRDDGAPVDFRVAGDGAQAAGLTPYASRAPFGLINANFCACWTGADNRPHDEPSVRCTGAVIDIQTDGQSVTRSLGAPRANLAIRFER